ncbi:hypothetical protein OH77DRAFT_1422029 [Trametes cingulata]|nr:hypothetical protein OH77DRAFT_1422029 [Trametes cingulata]
MPQSVRTSPQRAPTSATPAWTSKNTPKQTLFAMDQPHYKMAELVPGCIDTAPFLLTPDSKIRPPNGTYKFNVLGRRLCCQTRGRGADHSPKQPLCPVCHSARPNGRSSPSARPSAYHLQVRAPKSWTVSGPSLPASHIPNKTIPAAITARHRHELQARDEDVQHLPLLRSIMHQVEGAGTSMSHYCSGQYVWIERAYFPAEKGIRDENRVTPKYRDVNFTRADMLAFMIKKQHEHWSHVAQVWDEVDLEPLIGCSAIWAKGSKASWDSIYITAIRRRQSRAMDGGIRWFPELEVCVR